MKNSFKLQLFLLVVVATINTITCLKISTKTSYTDEKTSKTAKVALLSCANRNVSNAFYDIRTNEWIEAKLSTKCLQNSVQSVYRFCKRMYQSLGIINVENIGKQVAFTVEGICDSNDVSCDTKVNADMYKCVFGPYEDKALFVPPNCEYNEVSGDGKKCETQDYWLFKASETCKNSDKLLNASSLKKWCVGDENIGRFEGIQVVCCTSDEDDDIDDDEFDYDEDNSDEINNILTGKTEQKATKQQQQQIVKVDLTKNENEVVKQQEQDEDEDDASAIDGDQVEMNRYKAEKQKINQEYEDKKSKYVNEWNDQRAKTQEINNKDENKLKLIDDKYNKQLKEIDQEHQRLLEQEDDLHENIVQSSINERKASAKQNFDNELSKYQSQQTTSTERLLNAFKALFIAEERDRLHQITVYKRILDPSSENERVASIIRNLKLIDAQLSKCELEIRNVAGKQIDMKLSSLIDHIKGDYADIRKESDKLIQDYDKPQQQIVSNNNNNNNNNNNKVDVAKLSDDKNNNKEQFKFQTINDIIEGNNDDDDDDDDDYDDSNEENDSGDESVEDTNNANAKPDATKTPSGVVDNNEKKVVIDDDGSIEEDQSVEDENVDDDSVEVSNNNNNKQSEINGSNTNNNKPSDNNKDNDDDFESGEDDDDDSDESSSDEDDIQSQVVTNDKPVFKGNNPNKVDDSFQHDPLRDGNKLKTSTTSLFMYLAMGVCGTLFFVLILIGFMIRRGRSKYVQLQTPVDTYSPEEKHVSQMQQHGFVNPTYVALEKQV